LPFIDIAGTVHLFNDSILENITNVKLFDNKLTSNLTNEPVLEIFRDIPDEYRFVEMEVRRRHKLCPHLTLEEAYNTIFSLGSDGIDMALKIAEKEDQPLVNKLIVHEGKLIDVTKLSQSEIINLSSVVEDVDKFEALEHVKNTYSSTSPNCKIFYPEPFIASPSFIHNDIGFIHILQYQYWLWFLFIFLIVFFFISFLCVVRWCTNRNQPRRETRGVSRSKCGDLITATVPVTWAISIIVSESTDSTDYYDGFGTGELIVGVRAYQWGWHYYYPKTADLNYNVKPNYSSFVGNSLKYNTTTGKKINSNNLWRFYQQKMDDAVISPAHLLVLPSDNSRVLNLLNFKNIGTDNLQASLAFKQVRAHARIYTTNLTHNPSFLSNKYLKINNLYFNESDLVNSTNFGLKRQHNLTSTAATTSVNSTFLDSKSLSKFLSYGLQYNLDNNKTNYFNEVRDLWSKGSDSSHTSSVLNTFNLLTSGNKKFNNPSIRLLLSYPNIIKEFGDNSDNKPVNFPLRKLVKRSFTKPLKKRLQSKGVLINSSSIEDATSVTSNLVKINQKNTPSSSKEFMVSYPFQNIPTGEQSMRSVENLNENTSNLNLSNGLNSLDSNINKISSNSSFLSNSYAYRLNSSNWSDSTVFNKLASNRLYYNKILPVISTNPYSSRLNYDRTNVTSRKNYFSTNIFFNKALDPKTEEEITFLKKSYKTVSEDLGDNKIVHEIQDWNVKKSDTVQVLTKDRTGEDKLPSSAYWNMVWSQTNPHLRVSNVLSLNKIKEGLYLPFYVNYYDYDFRNAQALRSFEDILWESSYSSYNHQDYLTIYNKYREMYDSRSMKWGYLNSLFLNSDRDFDQSYRFGTNAKAKELKNIGSFYSNTIQSDEYFYPIHLFSRKDLSEIATINDSLVMDDSYSDQKNLNYVYISKSSIPFNVNSTFNYPQSHYSVLNNFRADFEDFSHYQDINMPSKSLLKTSGFDTKLFNFKSKNSSFASDKSSNFGKSLQSLDSSTVDNDPTFFNRSRFSNPLVLRRSAKSSMVTYQAFQKVFKLRYEEGRAHVRLTDFADSANTQPYTTEQRIKYDRMLGKNKIKFFNTIFNTNRVLPVFNNLAGLTNSMNFYFYEFPFLDGVTNDPTRHVWFDGFIKYAQREVSGSSVSKYTISGVPFYKKKFDFNVKQGKQMVDTELYFSRISVARKNYLPQWLYTPYLYTRSNIWYNDSRFDLFQNHSSYTNTFLNLRRMDWYWSYPSFAKTTSVFFTPSFSNSHKSTFRPYNQIQSYYYNLNTLTDLLTKREYLYRQTLENRNKIIELPKQLRATPKNPLINEIKSSFLLIDPITYNSEYSREFYYGTLSYFKFMLFKGWIFNINDKIKNLPINLKLVNEYLFFHLIEQNQTTTLGNRSDLRKSQYKPLKKGITSMMRLQGTSAVALPIEIRLQILASSKDVIHSWAIPSAGIKIDCIPGYSSHRIMIFFTPGIYWGQCMEICGRYHHWMPIILYFMKRDLFFLWCTHFLSKKDPYATGYNESNDRHFADYVNLITYDRSTW